MAHRKLDIALSTDVDWVKRWSRTGRSREFPKGPRWDVIWQNMELRGYLYGEYWE